MLIRSMPWNSRAFRCVVSAVIVVHFWVILANWISQRGSSYFIDSALPKFATYSALGNWRSDATAFSFANASQLGEEISLEVQRKEKNGGWSHLSLDPLVIVEASERRVPQRATSLETSWLRQLRGLLYYENEEGVGRMLMTVLPIISKRREQAVTGVRIRVAPRPTQDQFEVLNHAAEDRSIQQALEPQIVYSAMVVDLGGGQISLLPKLEERRASKSLVPPSVP